MPRILPFDSADLRELVHLNPQDWGDITPAFQQYLVMDNCAPMKLVADDHMVGVGTAIYHGATGWLGHIIVHPEFRSHGFGTFITQSLVDQLLHKQVQTILLLATELGEPIYHKLGFVSETRYVFFKADQSCEPFAPRENIFPFSSKYTDAVLALDLFVSGEDRRAWIFPYIDHAWLCLQEGTLEGYYIPGLGDGLIIASNDEAGCALMKFRLESHTDAVVPVDNKAAIRMLDQNGFIRHRTASRMWLGKKHYWKPERVYNRISGALG